ncbi:SDR family oxidoreductase [Roseivirga sp. BDSF3-8]|uniref:SDR family oxidoreductase n=1 Tax=Roseivirga sp. BDSF3-8 TaxID=3241598 RepID=UPI003531B04D
MHEPTNYKKTVSILGCGWVGLPLAELLISRGYFVRGSTTSSEKIQLLSAKGIEPYLLDIHNPPADSSGFYDCDILIVSVPPSLRKGVAGDDYVEAMTRAARQALKDKARQVVMISSTGVYPDTNGKVTEETPTATDDRSQVLYRAEEAWRNAFPERSIILRSAGLMGANRIPGKYFTGKKGLTTGQVPVNYIHRRDLVNILAKFCEGDCCFPGTFNAVAPEHPTRKEVYLRNSEQFGFEKPEFNADGRSDYKVVNGDKLRDELTYTFEYPDPLTFTYEPSAQQP